MNMPSVATIERAFPGKGRAIRKLLTDSAAVRAHPAAAALEARCYHAPSMADLRMAALDACAETFGIEAVFKAGDGCVLAFEYLNTGDMYAPTIIRSRDGRYRVASVGDLIERGNYR